MNQAAEVSSSIRGLQVLKILFDTFKCPCGLDYDFKNSYICFQKGIKMYVETLEYHGMQLLVSTLCVCWFTFCFVTVVE